MLCSFKWISISQPKLEAHHLVICKTQIFYLSIYSEISRIYLTACPDCHWMWCSKLLSQEQFWWWTLFKWRSRKFSQRWQVQKTYTFPPFFYSLLHHHFTQFEWRWGPVYELSFDRDGGNGMLYSQVKISKNSNIIKHFIVFKIGKLLETRKIIC